MIMVLMLLLRSFRLSRMRRNETVAFDINTSPWLTSMVHSISPMP